MFSAKGSIYAPKGEGTEPERSEGKEILRNETYEFYVMRPEAQGKSKKGFYLVFLMPHALHLAPFAHVAVTKEENAALRFRSGP
jgi:hypothetical protein